MIEVLKQVLEALELDTVKPSDAPHWVKTFNSINAVKKIIADLEKQEPVAWIRSSGNDMLTTQGYCTVYALQGISNHAIPLYTFPQSLQQEPVAWMRKLFSPELGEFFDYKDGAFANETDSEGWIPLYTSPQPRKLLTPQSPCEMTQAENKMFKLGWLECEAAHGIKE
jgi:hypothetical protein